MSGTGRAGKGWSVHYGDALQFWLFSRYPEEWEFDAVEAWVFRVLRDGPPRDQQRVLEDVFQALVRPTAVIVTYLVDEAEQVVIVREFC